MRAEAAPQSVASMTPDDLEQIIGRRLHERHEQLDNSELPRQTDTDLLSRPKALSYAPLDESAALRLMRGRNSAATSHASGLRCRDAFSRDRGATSGCDFRSAQILSERREREPSGGAARLPPLLPPMAEGVVVAGGGGGRLPRHSELSMSTPAIHGPPLPPPRRMRKATSREATLPEGRPPSLKHLPSTARPAVGEYCSTHYTPESAGLSAAPEHDSLLEVLGISATPAAPERSGVGFSAAARELSRKGVDMATAAGALLRRGKPGEQAARKSSVAAAPAAGEQPRRSPRPLRAGTAGPAAGEQPRRPSQPLRACTEAFGVGRPLPLARVRSAGAEPPAAEQPPRPAWRRRLEQPLALLQRLVLHPHSLTRLRWERVIFAAVMATVVEAPFFACFLEHAYTGAPWLTIMIDVLIGCDVVANLLTGYVSDDANRVEMRLLPIAAHYAASWLLLDLVAAWPVRFVAHIVASSCSDSTCSYSSIVRIGRLARCLKAPLVMRTLRRSSGARSSLPAVIVLSYLIAMHWFTCLQWALPRAQGYPPESWPVVTGTLDEPITRRYVQTAFNTISQMASIGYGNYQPTTEQELITTMFNILVGNAAFGLLVSAFAVKLSSTDSCTRAHDERLEAVNQYLALTAMPVELRQRVRAHFVAQFPTNKLYDEKGLLDALPFQLRRDLNLVRARTLYQRVPLFRVGGTAFMVQVSQQLSAQHALPGEYLLHEGELIAQVVFIDEGAVEILVGPELALVAELHDGDFLGEAACMREHVYAVTTARVLRPSLIFSIRGGALREVLGRFPDAKLAVMHVINSRLDVLERHRPHRFNLAHVPPNELHGGHGGARPPTSKPAALPAPAQPAGLHRRSASFS